MHWWPGVCSAALQHDVHGALLAQPPAHIPAWSDVSRQHWCTKLVSCIWLECYVNPTAQSKLQSRAKVNPSLRFGPNFSELSSMKAQMKGSCQHSYADRTFLDAVTMMLSYVCTRQVSVRNAYAKLELQPRHFLHMRINHWVQMSWRLTHVLAYIHSTDRRHVTLPRSCWACIRLEHVDTHTIMYVHAYTLSMACA